MFLDIRGGLLVRGVMVGLKRTKRVDIGRERYAFQLEGHLCHT